MKYNNFEAAIYFNVFDLINIKDAAELEHHYEFFTKHIKLSKVYLETFRCSVHIDPEKMQMAKDFFIRKGIKVSGGITTAVQGSTIWEFKSFCYTNPEQREELKKVVKLTAELFDEIILDDFYFTNCKCESCIKAKGDRSWSDFRTGLMKEVSENIVLKEAKTANPKVRVIIKYPNWYDHYQSTGYNLKDEPAIFDAVYTGTETRDSEYTQQNLQKYTSYFLMRYLENIKPGKNLGGWFDTYDCMNRMGAYLEQAYLTLFAKAREITLYCAGTLARQYRLFVPITGFVFDELDQHIDKLGNPMGLFCYKPANSIGEDYLHGYLGMLGIPLEPISEYPANQPLVLLTESAIADNKIVDKIKVSLMSGNTVIMTSGLLKALQNKGIEDIAEVTCSDRKVSLSRFACDMKECAFKSYYDASKEILFPQIDFSTNDTWQIAVGISEQKNFPLLLETKYGKGQLYILTIPDNFGDLYHLPEGVLNTLRSVFAKNQVVSIEAPSNVGLFLYDNDTFIVESFHSCNKEITIIVNKENAVLKNIITEEKLEGIAAGSKTHFKVNLQPTSYKMFKFEI
ncbi:MAG: permease [Clostridia bacterium]|nr:permease [Clostridia bacterium]